MKKLSIIVLLAALAANLSFANEIKPIDRLLHSGRIITSNDLQKLKNAFIRSIVRTNNYTDYLPLTGGTLTGSLIGTDATFTSSGVPLILNSTASGGAYFSLQRSGTTYGIIGNAGSVTGTNTDDLAIQATNSLRFQTNSNHTALMIDASQNVGIGTTSPSNRLTVQGPDGAYAILAKGSATTGQSYGLGIFGGINSSDYSFVVANQAASSYYFVVRGDGNVGIGTISPSEQVTVVATSSPKIALGVYADANGRAARIATSDYNGGTSTGSDLRVGMGAGTGNTYTSFQGFTAGESSANGNIVFQPSGGNVGIGTTTPSEKLSVYGNIRSEKIIVTQSGWPDYVFNPSFKLKPLLEVEQFIKANNHLPGVPSAKEVADKGVDLGATEAVLLKKMEEMTLYMIEINKKIEKLESENKLMKKQLRTSK